jgi:ectoine hydroxylase-related dioxygenase (phytanoyl-CoA dioxygenase family)
VHAVRQRLAERGYVALPALLRPDAIGQLAANFADIPSNSGGQRLVGAALASLMSQPALAAVIAVLRNVMDRPVTLRAVAFRKTVEANWFVPAHQDRSIPIAGDTPPAGFSRATRKDGWQAEAPVTVLESMINIRVFIDDARADDGPLEVVPGTHRTGRLDQATIAASLPQENWSLLTGNAGDAVLLSPLLVHRSRRAASPNGRRVLQIECLPAAVAAQHALPGIALDAVGA